MRVLQRMLLSIGISLALTSSPAVSNELERAKNAVGTAVKQAADAGEVAIEQGKTNAQHLADDLNKAGAKAIDQGETNAKHAGARIERDGENFFRWIREDKCDRVRRKDGEEAEKQCRKEVAENDARFKGAAQTTYKYFAAMEIDCSSPRKDWGIWGNVTLWGYSNVSKEDAKAQVLKKMQNGKVCAREHKYDELTDSESRWVS
jgi:hypothetical protein